MLQIAIWGIAAMLVVKALDVLHQQSISRASGNLGSEGLSTAAAAIAIVSAIGLVYLASAQVNAMPQQSNPFGLSDDSAIQQVAADAATDAVDYSNVSRGVKAAGEAADKAASEAAGKM